MPVTTKADQPISLWRPFVGPVFEKVMENLKESLSRDPREVYVVYLKSAFESLVAGIPSMRSSGKRTLGGTKYVSIPGLQS